MTLEEAKNYLRIDFTEDDTFIQTLIDTSQIYIDECVGETYKNSPNLVKLAIVAQYKIIDALYNNKNMYEIKKDRIVETIFTRLALEEDVTTL